MLLVNHRSLVLPADHLPRLKLFSFEQLKSNHVHSQIVATFEAFLHADDLTEHLLLVFHL